jgi:hypothetical protein
VSDNPITVTLTPDAWKEILTCLEATAGLLQLNEPNEKGRSVEALRADVARQVEAAK